MPTPPTSPARAPAESLGGRLLGNVAGGIGATVVLMGVQFLFTPYLVRSLGPDAFGLWTLAFTLSRYTSVLDGGLMSAVRRFQTRALAAHDTSATNEVLGVSLRVYGMVGALSVAITLSGLVWLPRTVEIPPAVRVALPLVLVVAAATTFLTFLRTAFAGILFGANRIDLERGVQLVDRVGFALLAVAGLALWRSDLAAPSIAALVSMTASAFVAVRLARRVAPGLRVSLGSWRSPVLKEMLHFSSDALVLAIAGLTITHAPKLIVGAWFDARHVAYIGVVLQLVRYVYEAFSPISGAIFPLAARVETSRGATALAELYQRASRLMLVLAIAAVVPLAVVGSDFLRLWVGEEYAPYGRALTVLLAGELFRLAQMTGLHVLTATRSIRLASLGQAANAMLVLVLMLTLLRGTDLGVEAAAIAIAIPAALFWGLFLPITAARALDLDPRRYWLATYPRAFVAGAATAAACAYLRSLVAGPAGIVATAAIGAAGAATMLALGLVLVLDRDDRRVVAALARRALSTMPGARRTGR